MILWRIEIKSSESLSNNDFKGLRKFKEMVGSKFLQGILLYAGSTHLPFWRADMTALPITSPMDGSCMNK